MVLKYLNKKAAPGKEIRKDNDHADHLKKHQKGLRDAQVHVNKSMSDKDKEIEFFPSKNKGKPFIGFELGRNGSSERVQGISKKKSRQGKITSRSSLPDARSPASLRSNSPDIYRDEDGMQCFPFFF